MNKTIIAPFLGIALCAGCSSSNDGDSGNGELIGGNGSDNSGGGGVTLTSIASTNANSAPAVLSVEQLQQSFDSITSAQPVPVQDTDTVTTLLEKAGL